jgi:hypothetical protein
MALPSLVLISNLQAQAVLACHTQKFCVARYSHTIALKFTSGDNIRRKSAKLVKEKNTQ